VPELFFISDGSELVFKYEYTWKAPGPLRPRLQHDFVFLAGDQQAFEWRESRLLGGFDLDLVKRAWWDGSAQFACTRRQRQVHRKSPFGIRQDLDLFGPIGRPRPVCSELSTTRREDSSATDDNVWDGIVADIDHSSPQGTLISTRPHSHQGRHTTRQQLAPRESRFYKRFDNRYPVVGIPDSEATIGQPKILIGRFQPAALVENNRHGRCVGGLV